MSTDNPQPSDQENSSDETDAELSDTYQTKLEAHQRDGYRCLNCRETFEERVSQLDADHIVPRGAGGSSLHRNIGSLCRKCHEAKHGEREIAPTIRFMSTGDMTDKEFRWFRHFWDEILPALAEAAIGQRIEPLTDIDDSTPWQGRHIPIGVARFCDDELADRDDVDYAPQGAHNVW